MGHSRALVGRYIFGYESQPTVGHDSRLGVALQSALYSTHDIFLRIQKDRKKLEEVARYTARPLDAAESGQRCLLRLGRALRATRIPRHVAHVSVVLTANEAGIVVSKLCCRHSSSLVESRRDGPARCYIDLRIHGGSMARYGALLNRMIKR